MMLKRDKKKWELLNRVINMSVYVIAEVGVNHNGSVNIAKELVRRAKQAGADCVKFQTFIAENVVTQSAERAAYQDNNTKNNDSQLEMLKKLELSFSEFEELKGYCEEQQIDFLSTPFDLESIDFLQKLDLKFWKIPSGEITNLPYLEKIARTGKPVVLSTGMSDMQEVTDAVDILKKNGSQKICIMHCTTEYPADLSDCNLNVISALEKQFCTFVGYSDHTEGIFAPLIAVAKGARVIEKHFTLDRSMEGPDHKASLEPDELEKMISRIRLVEDMLGDGIKRPAASEIPNKSVARKSIVAKKSIKKGERFTEDNITVKRPGAGISPMRWYDVLGSSAVRSFEKDDLIIL